MALLLETTLGDLVIDLDIEGSPELSKNVLKLAKARYYTSTLVYNVQPNRFCQLGDPQGDGTGGACIFGLIATLLEEGTLDNDKVRKSHKRFLKSSGGRSLTREECRRKGMVVATEMNGIADTIGSQLLITTSEGTDRALDGFRTNDDGEDVQLFRSVGLVREDDDNVLDKIAAAYCDADGRPYADIRVVRALVVDDPFDDPPGMEQLLKERDVEVDDYDNVTASPSYERPTEENIEIRIQADQIDPLMEEEDPEKVKQQEEEMLKREDRSRAVVLEMLGDLPDADMKPPENVLFICKLNPVTEDEDLELIFSRFDEKVKAEIIRDHDTGASLQYAFVEFTKKEQAQEAYFKMNNALVDDRRIKVDFSQSVAKVWNKYNQRARNPGGNVSNQLMPKDPFTEQGRQPHTTIQNQRGGQYPRHQGGRNGDPQRPHRPETKGRHGFNHNHNHQRDDEKFRRSRERSPNRRRHNDVDSVDSFGRRVPDGELNHMKHHRELRGNDASHHSRRRHEERNRRKYDSDSSASRQRKKSRDRSRSRSRGDREDERRRSRHHAKKHRKRSRRDSGSDDEESRDSSRRRERKREKHHRHRDHSERRKSRDRDRADDDRERYRKSDHDRKRDRKRHRHEHRDRGTSRSDQKDSERHRRKDSR